MTNKKNKELSVVGLIASLVPLLTFAEILFKIELSATAQTVWAGINIFSVVVALGLSIIAIKDKESRSIINITSFVLSLVWALNILGVLAIVVLVNFS